MDDGKIYILNLAQSLATSNWSKAEIFSGYSFAMAAQAVGTGG